MTGWLKMLYVDDVLDYLDCIDVWLKDTGPTRRVWRITLYKGGRTIGVLSRFSAHDPANGWYNISLPRKMVDIMAMWLRMKGVI